jgi:hypothetical protein
VTRFIFKIMSQISSSWVNSAGTVFYEVRGAVCD